MSDKTDLLRVDHCYVDPSGVQWRLTLGETCEVADTIDRLRAENEMRRNDHMEACKQIDRLTAEVEQIRIALGGYRDSNLASLATTLRARCAKLESEHELYPLELDAALARAEKAKRERREQRFVGLVREHYEGLAAESLGAAVPICADSSRNVGPEVGARVGPRPPRPRCRMTARLPPLAAVQHQGHCPHAHCTGALWRDCTCSTVWRREYWGREQWEQWRRVTRRGAA